MLLRYGNKGIATILKRQLSSSSSSSSKFNNIIRMKEKILIDTDPGIDDAMAIHLAFSHPNLEVIGLTTIFGNVEIATATRNALRLVEMAAYPNCPVAQGATHPLVKTPTRHADFVHGTHGFGDVLPATTPPSQSADPRSAAQFIVDTIQEHPPHTITLCPVGPLTNIALALELDPSITKRVKKLVIMGGTVHKRPGNVNDFAEANIWNDPHAADAVLAADWSSPVMLVGLDVTEKPRLLPQHFVDLAKAAPTIGGFLNEAVQFYFQFHLKKNIDGCFMHDPSAILAVAEPELFHHTSQLKLGVTVSGERAGEVYISTDSKRRPVEVCLDVHVEDVLERFCAVLSQADVCRDAQVALTK
jgi:inosine-uridine nucleoside N-ribohydrolase